MSVTEHVDGRRERGRQTRASILATAADVASVEGLEGLTIGRLAGELGMSKSGLFAHFGSKEELQLATIAAAREIYVEHVVEPARTEPAGVPRLRALVRAWRDYMRAKVFAGGCFFTAIRAEFDSRPGGAVRDAIVEQQAEWSALLAHHVRKAIDAGQLPPDTDPDELAFEIDALISASKVRYQLTEDPKVLDWAAAAIDQRLALPAA